MTDIYGVDLDIAASHGLVGYGTYGDVNITGGDIAIPVVIGPRMEVYGSALADGVNFPSSGAFDTRSLIPIHSEAPFVRTAYNDRRDIIENDKRGLVHVNIIGPHRTKKTWDFGLQIDGRYPEVKGVMVREMKTRKLYPKYISKDILEVKIPELDGVLGVLSAEAVWYDKVDGRVSKDIGSHSDLLHTWVSIYKKSDGWYLHIHDAYARFSTIRWGNRKLTGGVELWVKTLVRPPRGISGYGLAILDADGDIVYDSVRSVNLTLEASISVSKDRLRKALDGKGSTIDIRTTKPVVFVVLDKRCRAFYLSNSRWFAYVLVGRGGKRHWVYITTHRTDNGVSIRFSGNTAHEYIGRLEPQNSSFNIHVFTANM